MLWEYYISYNASIGHSSWFWGCGTFTVPHVLDSWEKIEDLTAFVKEHVNSKGTNPAASTIVIMNFQLIKIHGETE